VHPTPLSFVDDHSSIRLLEFEWDVLGELLRS
jgi:hypothetical protein